MIACNICDIKLFTKKLFIGETFDRFLLKEAEIVTFNTFSIDGRVHKSFYSEEERAEGQIEEYSTWKTLRPFCFSLIKGKKLPERFSIILKLPKCCHRTVSDRPQKPMAPGAGRRTVLKYSL